MDKVQRRWQGRGGTWSRHTGLGSGLGRPAQLSQEALTPWPQAAAHCGAGRPPRLSLAQGSHLTWP